MKRSTIGIWFILAPFIILGCVLVAYPLVNFAISSMLASSVDPSVAQGVVQGEPDMRSTIGNILNVALGLLGMLGVIGIPVLGGIGVYFLVTDPKDKKKA